MRVFLAGGTGYVGRAILRQLVSERHDVVALVRPGSQSKLPPDAIEKISTVVGDALEPSSYRDALRRCSAVIYLPGLLREFPSRGITFERVHELGVRKLVDGAKEAGAERFLLMSALGVRPDSRTDYQRTKYRAEEYLRRSDLYWSVFRPSVIFGNEQEGLQNFFIVLTNLVKLLPFVVPVPGSGEYRFQPVSVQDLARGFVASLTSEKAISRVYDVAGPDEYTYNELVTLMGMVAAKHKILLHVPMRLMKAIAKMIGRFPSFPITSDQLVMLEEGSLSAEWRTYFDDFKVKPTRLTESFGVRTDAFRNNRDSVR